MKNVLMPHKPHVMFAALSQHTDVETGNVREQTRRPTAHCCFYRVSLRPQEVGDDISVCCSRSAFRQFSGKKQLRKQGLTGLKSMGK